jgi:hypothetical protein
MKEAKMNTSTKFKAAAQKSFDVLEELVSLLIAIVLLIYTNFIAQGQQGNIILLINGVLLVVSLIAISNLRDRLYRFRRIEEIVDKTHQEILDKTILRSTGADEFFTNRDETFGKFLATSSSIDISGITLTGTIHGYSAVLQERLENAAKIRIIILDSNSDDALRQLVLRSWSDVATPEYYKNYLRSISQLIENIGNVKQAKGSLEIGYLPFVPSFGISILKREQIHSLAFIKFYHHQTNASSGFMTDMISAPKTFGLYEEQFEIMWRECKTRKLI